MAGRMLAACGLALSALVGCGAPDPPPSTGGTGQDIGPCGRGMLVIGSDFQSTNVSLIDVSGEVLSSSFISSASEATGLSAPLSGDVVSASGVELSAEVVLIDRYPASVLTWVDVVSASVRAQLNVATGFAANPQDYVLVSDAKAYVSRFETNPSPGAEPFDAGGDLLVVDPRAPVITGRVELSDAMSGEPGMLPRAGRMLLVGGRLHVLLAGYSADFTESAASRIVTIDPVSDAIEGVTVLNGMYGCGVMAVEPSRWLDGDEVQHPRLAVACSGEFGGTSTPSLAQSGVVVLTTDGGLPVETARFGADAMVGQPLGFGLDWGPAGDKLLVTALGAFGQGGSDIPDALVELELASGAARVVAQSPSLPFEMGDVRCASLLAELPAGDVGSCGSCFLADAERGELLRMKSAGSVEVDATIDISDAIGLPPRLLGRF